MVHGLSITLLAALCLPSQIIVPAAVPNADVPKFLKEWADEGRLVRDSVSTLVGSARIESKLPFNHSNEVYLESLILEGDFLLDCGADELISRFRLVEPRKYFSIAAPDVDAHLAFNAAHALQASSLCNVWVHQSDAFVLHSDIVFGARNADPKVYGWFAQKSNLVRSIPVEQYAPNLRLGLALDPRRCYDPFETDFPSYLSDLAAKWEEIEGEKSVFIDPDGACRISFNVSGLHFLYSLSEKYGMQLTSAVTTEVSTGNIVHRCQINYQHFDGEILPVSFLDESHGRASDYQYIQSRSVVFSSVVANRPFENDAFNFLALGCDEGDRVQDMVDQKLSIVSADGRLESPSDFEVRYKNGQFSAHSSVIESTGGTSYSLFVKLNLALIALIVATWCYRRRRQVN